jgi:hypothetical protein
LVESDDESSAFILGCFGQPTVRFEAGMLIQFKVGLRLVRPRVELRTKVGCDHAPVS